MGLQTEIVDGPEAGLWLCITIDGTTHRARLDRRGILVLKDACDEALFSADMWFQDWAVRGRERNREEMRGVPLSAEQSSDFGERKATELEQIKDWMREPDYAPEFDVDDAISWCGRRPLATLYALERHIEALHRQVCAQQSFEIVSPEKEER